MDQVDFCVLPHFRPNLWNGAATRPSLLQVGEGRICVTAHDDRLLFDEPVGSCAVRVTRLGTMKIRTPQRTFDFYGRGSAISDGANPQQAAYVQQFWTGNPPYPQLHATLFDPKVGSSLKPLAAVLVQSGLQKG